MLTFKDFESMPSVTDRKNHFMSSKCWTCLKIKEITLLKWEHKGIHYIAAFCNECSLRQRKIKLSKPNIQEIFTFKILC